MKKTVKIIIFVLLLNALVIFLNIKSGIGKGDMMFRFREREAVTFLSALMLGLTSLTSLFIYKIKKKANILSRGVKFWLFSSIGFFYLCMDEYFMAHEGMDEIVGSLFGKNIKDLNLDGLVIGAFGLLALGVCIYFRKELFKHKVIFPFLFLGAFGLCGTVLFHMLERIDIVFEVIEESLKVLGVSFFFVSYLVALSFTLGKSSISYQE